jgi:hypothetical protein
LLACEGNGIDIGIRRFGDPAAAQGFTGLGGVSFYNARIQLASRVSGRSRTISERPPDGKLDARAPLR